MSDQAEALASLADEVRNCTRCGLCADRIQAVFGVGSPYARLMFVGEAPGFHEDKQGEPFVGAAGKLLTSMLEKIGLTRPDVYIANVIKCRPPENRDPSEDEIAACSPHLMRQIAIIRPTVICTLGRFAMRLLTGSELSMTAVHGKAKPMNLGGTDTIVFPVFHPAAALYQPSNRAVLEEDFQRLLRLLDRGAGALKETPPIGDEHTESGAEPERSAAPEPAVEEVANPAIVASTTDTKVPPPPPPAAAPVPPSSPAEQLPLW